MASTASRRRWNSRSRSSHVWTRARSTAQLRRGGAAPRGGPCWTTFVLPALIWEAKCGDAGAARCAAMGAAGARAATAASTRCSRTCRKSRGWARPLSHEDPSHSTRSTCGHRRNTDGVRRATRERPTRSAASRRQARVRSAPMRNHAAQMASTRRTVRAEALPLVTEAKRDAARATSSMEAANIELPCQLGSGAERLARS
jgi:hypothetical protein